MVHNTLSQQFKKKIRYAIIAVTELSDTEYKITVLDIPQEIANK